MRLMGLQSVAPKPNTSQAVKQHKVYPYLLKGMTIDRPNQVWCTDITYIRLAKGSSISWWLWTGTVARCFRGKCRQSMEDSFCISALERALRLYPKPEIFNTDQEPSLRNAVYRRAKENEIRISMDGKGRAMDNIFIERLWRSVKYEEIYLNEYRSIDDLKKALRNYFNFL